jgi:hypothetical protein
MRLKTIRYVLEVCLILIPLGCTLYFASHPDQFNASLDWLMGR